MDTRIDPGIRYQAKNCALEILDCLEEDDRFTNQRRTRICQIWSEAFHQKLFVHILAPPLMMTEDPSLENFTPEAQNYLQKADRKIETFAEKISPWDRDQGDIIAVYRGREKTLIENHRIWVLAKKEDNLFKNTFRDWFRED